MVEQAAQDAVAIAAQTGRLDLVTAILAVLALLLGLAAFPLFFYLRYRAEKAAKEAVEEVLKGAVERVEREAIFKLEELLPTLVEEYALLARGAASGEVADKIAAAQDGDGEA